jgi:phage terminase large subunit-like protein
LPLAGAIRDNIVGALLWVAAKNDRSVGTTWGIKEKYYLLDAHVGRWDLPELARQVVERARF